MSKSERDLVSRILKQSILALCKEAVSYSRRLEVDGIVCVTLDNETDHVIKIHELLSKPGLPSSPITDSNTDGENNNWTTVRQQSTVPILVPESVRTLVKTEEDPVPETNNGDDDRTPSPTTGSLPNLTEIKTEPETPKSQTVPSPIDAPKPTKLEVSTARNITCKKCNAVLEDARQFESHNMTSHGYFTCMVCLVTFTSRNNMKRHLRLHTGVKPYTCSHCSESFARNDDYKRHLLRHTFDKPFRCTLCKSGYSDRSCVKNHMIKEHKSKIYYICPQCGESYVDAQQFQQHKKIHPEFQEFRCALCSFTGSNSLMYNKHMLTHGVQKRYKCGHCEVPFNDPFSYTNHMKRHKGDDLVQTYNCCFCDHVSQTYEQFQRHEHSHIQPKQHTCNICEKHFRYPSTLREHMLTHKTTVPTSAASDNSGHAMDTNERTTDTETGTNTVFPQRDTCYDVTEEMDTPVEAEENDCVDYWCTECNQGFGTEYLLQTHIMNTHESANETTQSLINDTRYENQTRASNFSERPNGDMDAIDLTQKKMSQEAEVNPYEVNTQRDSPTDYFEEDTRLTVSRKRVFDEETVSTVTGDDHTKFRLPTQTERKKVSGQRKQSITQIAKRPRVFDEETVIDDDDLYQEDIDTDVNAQKSGQAVQLSATELNIASDAIREVQRIQSRFGIRPTLNPNLATTSSRGNEGRVVKNQTTGIWKSLAAVKKSRMWNKKDKDGDTFTSGTTIPKSVLSQRIDELSTLREALLDANGNKTLSPESIYKNSLGGGIADSASNDPLPLQYSKTSVLGMDTEFSATHNSKSPTILNLQMKSPGFEKVITPSILFKDRAPFTCELCKETFQDYEGFDQHGIAVHRRYICLYCGKPFTSRPNRERHVRYHTGEKPYKCDACTASFYRGDDLKYHRTTKHSDIRPFMCATCKVSFAVPKELAKHLREYPDHRLKDNDQ